MFNISVGFNTFLLLGGGGGSSLLGVMGDTLTEGELACSEMEIMKKNVKLPF